MQPGLRTTILARVMGMSPRDGKCLSCRDTVIKTRVDLTATFRALPNPIPCPIPRPFEKSLLSGPQQSDAKPSREYIMLRYI